MTQTKDRWDDRLMCYVVSLSYDFTARTGSLHMGESNCCDRAGCIALFVGIDPKVKLIRTFQGEQPDTVYRRTPNGWDTEMPAQHT